MVSLMVMTNDKWLILNVYTIDCNTYCLMPQNAIRILDSYYLKKTLAMHQLYFTKVYPQILPDNKNITMKLRPIIHLIYLYRKLYIYFYLYLSIL